MNVPNKTRGRRKTRLGITLVEAVIGIFMLAILTLSVLGMLTASEKVNRQAEIRSVASAIARQQLDKVVAQNGLNRLPVSNQAFTIPASVLDLLPADQRGQKLQGVYSISYIGGNPNLQQVSVRVWWTNASTNQSNTSPTTEVRLSTLVASTEELRWRPSGSSRDDVFVPPPPPPPPPPPVPLTTGGTDGGGSTGGSSGGSTGSDTGSTTGGTGGDDDDDGGGGGGGSTGSTGDGSSGGSTDGGSTGGSSGGSSGGSGDFNFDFYGGQWR